MAAKSETLPHLLDVVKAKYPESVGPERWYLIAASALITNSDPSNLGQLWVHLTHQSEYQSIEKRKTLNTRLREFLLKQWITIGVPYVFTESSPDSTLPKDSIKKLIMISWFRKVAVALFSLIKEERAGDADLGFTKQSTALTPANRAQGERFLSHVYTQEQMTAMWTAWGQNFEWLTKEVVYGMFYSDDAVIDAVDTQLINYTATVSQGLGITVRIQLGGLLGLGLNVEEIEGVTECGKLVAKWAGVDTAGWPDVKAIAAEIEKKS